MARESLVRKLYDLQVPHSGEKLPGSVPAFPEYEKPTEQFREELEKVGGIFLDGRSEVLLIRALERILLERGSEVLCWEHPAILEKHGVPFERLSTRPRTDSFFFSHHTDGKVRSPLELQEVERSVHRVEEIEISVASAVLGVAETGSILEQSGAGRGRILSILPPVHVALLSEQDLVMNHSDWFAEAEFGRSESAQLLITGPSRTADIEKTLIIGVHGPRYLYVILTG